MSSFVFNTPKSIRFGEGAIAEVGNSALLLGVKKMLIVTDPHMVSIGFSCRIEEWLARSGIKSVLFSEVEADPPVAKILAATELVPEHQIDGVIGIGGGSSLDVAKLVALLAKGKERLEDIYGIGLAKGPRLPLILVPTTAGTGSEVTPISIVTTPSQQKMGVVSPLLFPDFAIVDPELTYGLPPHITAATGIDAIVHAIEAFASKNPNNNPISRCLAVDALKLMIGSLVKAVQKGTDTQARNDMMLGSMMAGQAFANSPVAAVHALAYPLGGHFHIPHGLSNALVLGGVLQFNIKTHPEPYAALAELIWPDLSKLTVGERANAFCQHIQDLTRQCGLPANLQEMDIKLEDLPMLAADAMEQTRLLGNNPRIVTKQDALRIYTAAYYG